MTTDPLAALGVSAYVLHLARATDRHEPLLSQAANQNIQLRVLHASDGEEGRFRSWLFPSRHAEGTCADIIGAIFESHLRAWRLAAAQDPGTHLLVMEDDVSLPTNFTAYFERGFRELPASYDMAMLGTTSTPSFRKHPGTVHLLRPDESDANGQALLGSVPPPRTRTLRTAPVPISPPVVMSPTDLPRKWLSRGQLLRVRRLAERRPAAPTAARRRTRLAHLLALRADAAWLVGVRRRRPLHRRRRRRHGGLWRDASDLPASRSLCKPPAVVTRSVPLPPASAARPTL